MAKLVRFGVAMEDSLLKEFDRYIRRKGYKNRSEAMRDLARNAIVQEAWEQGKGEVIATVALVYNHEKRGLADKLTDLQHHAGPLIVSTLHVHLDERHCLEVVVLRGKASQVRKLVNQILATKGVLHGGVTATGVPVAKAGTEEERSCRLGLNFSGGERNLERRSELR
jgi:CopG family nickel-responsive transcriptional regulator